MFSLPHESRQSSEPITIYHYGYLLKRSNKPFQNPSFSKDPFVTPPINGSKDETCTAGDSGTHLPQHVDVPEITPKETIALPIPKRYTSDSTSGCDIAISMASAFFGLPETTNSKDKEIKDDTDNEYSNEDQNHQNIKSIVNVSKQPFQNVKSPTASPRINIPRKNVSPQTSTISNSPRSHHTDEPDRVYRSSSSPMSYSSDSRLGEISKIPHNMIDPRDGHIWRAKYCILENGILYFYRNEADANTPKAKSERKEKTLFNRTQAQISSPKSSYLRNTPIDSLSTSPIPRNPLTNKSNSLFNPESDVMWEKRVALDCVGAVRSAEDEHGKYSFVLLTSAENNTLEEQDCLVLRSSSTKEMQEWLFQIHRSLASIVKEMVFQRPSGSMLLPPEVHYPLVGISPRFMSIDKKVLLNNNQTSVSYSPKVLHGSMNVLHSLSHGHGRNDVHRRRVRDRANSASRSRSSSVDSQKTDPFVAWETESTDAPFDLVDENVIATVLESSKPFSPAETDLDESQHSTGSSRVPSPLPIKPINSIPSTGKYIPPHLRKKQLSGKYIPPHLRNKQSNSMSQAPFSLMTNTSEEIVSTEYEKKENTLDATTISNSTCNDDSKHRSKSVIIEPVSSHFKLGGCADKDISAGTIMDATYKKRSLKLGTGRTETYGFTCNNSCNTLGDMVQSNRTSLGWEVGAVSACGVRSSNEDAYLIANDLVHVLRSERESDECKKQDLVDGSSPGLFAVFDGHCGFQTARFAAEKFTSFLNESIINLTPAKEETKIEDFFLDGNLVTEVLHSAISALDDDFCTRSTTDGREWGDAGATALVTVISNETLYVANLGDCRGILCGSCIVNEQGHNQIYQPLSENDGWSMLEEDENIRNESRKLRTFWKEVTDIHSPSRQDEKERIEKANGWTTTEQEICFGQIQRMDLEDKDALDILKRWFSHRFKEFDDDQPEEVDGKKKKFKAAPGRLLKIYRICGELGVSRALGDKDFKSAFNSPPAASLHGIKSTQMEEDWWEGPNYLPYPETHNGCFQGDLVSSTPEFQVLKIGNAGVSKEFLILGCDGLWDVMDADDAARIARDLMFEKGWSAESSAARLAELAIHLGSSDNITVILIRFYRHI